MKKILAMLTCLILVNIDLSYGDNMERIKELKAESQTLSIQVQQAQTFIQNAQVKLIGNSAVITELERLDNPKQDKPKPAPVKGE